MGRFDALAADIFLGDLARPFHGQMVEALGQDDRLPRFDRPADRGIAIADPLPLHEVDLPGFVFRRLCASLAAASAGGAAAETAGGDFVAARQPQQAHADGQRSDHSDDYGP